MYQIIETPFKNRNDCWFCGEPRDDKLLKFPAKKDDINYIEHAAINIPICNECNSYKTTEFYASIFLYRDYIKGEIVRRHNKLLGIGLNWTKQELITSELEGIAFEGFKKSAWPLFEIAKSKINFKGWELIVRNQPLLSYNRNVDFIYDDIEYQSVEEATKVVVSQLDLDR